MSGAVAAMMLGHSGAPGTIQTLPNGTAAGVAVFSLGNDGSTAISGNATGSWVEPDNATVAAQWQVKVDVTSGAFFGGSAVGSWLDMSLSREWTSEAPDPAVTFTISFREKASGTVRKVQTGLTLTAT